MPGRRSPFSTESTHSSPSAQPEGEARSKLASLLQRHKISFVQRVVLLNIASHQSFPTVYEMYGVFGTEMSAESGLISPTLQKNEFSGLCVFYGVVRNVPMTLSCFESKGLKLGSKSLDAGSVDYRCSKAPGLPATKKPQPAAITHAVCWRSSEVSGRIKARFNVNPVMQRDINAYNHNKYAFVQAD